jgi:hypothetical protein
MLGCVGQEMLVGGESASHAANVRPSPCKAITVSLQKPSLRTQKQMVEGGW